MSVNLKWRALYRTNFNWTPRRDKWVIYNNQLGYKLDERDIGTVNQIIPNYIKRGELKANKENDVYK